MKSTAYKIQQKRNMISKIIFVALVLFMTMTNSFKLESQSYCAPTATYPYYYPENLYISRVAFNGIDNSSSYNSNYGNSDYRRGYQDFSSISSNACSPGSYYNLNINLDGRYHSYFARNLGGVKVWVDWNNDNDFNDAGESVISVGVQPGTIDLTNGFSGQIQIPANASAGNYRMRIRAGYYYYIHINSDACSEYTGYYVENEDYTISVGISDNTAPTVVTQNRTVYLDANGQASVTAAEIDNGSYDANDIVSLELDVTDFTCDDLGDNTVTLTVTDEYNNSGTGTATVTVVDNTAPVISNCPTDIVVYTGANSTSCGATVTWDEPTASDNCSYTLTSNKSNDNVYPVGTTTVTYTATDGSNNTSTCSFNVTVIDNTPPVVNNLTLSQNSLWPPNHSMVTINVASFSGTDNCSENLTYYIKSITSNEDENGYGDGDTPNDWTPRSFPANTSEFELRAERSGRGNNRVYTILFGVIDANGNETEVSTTVVCPHSRRPRVAGEEEQISENLSFTFSYYPNPTNDFLTITSENNEKSVITIRILDLIGNEVISKNITGSFNINETFDISKAIPGLYFIEFRKNDTKITRKFTKL